MFSICQRAIIISRLLPLLVDFRCNAVIRFYLFTWDNVAVTTLLFISFYPFHFFYRFDDFEYIFIDNEDNFDGSNFNWKYSPPTAIILESSQSFGFIILLWSSKQLVHFFLVTLPSRLLWCTTHLDMSFFVSFHLAFIPYSQWPAHWNFWHLNNLTKI